MRSSIAVLFILALAQPGSLRAEESSATHAMLGSIIVGLNERAAEYNAEHAKKKHKYCEKVAGWRVYTIFSHANEDGTALEFDEIAELETEEFARALARSLGCWQGKFSITGIVNYDARLAHDHKLVKETLLKLSGEKKFKAIAEKPLGQVLAGKKE